MGAPSLFSTSRQTAIMSAINKIAANSPSRAKPSELETSIAGALYDLESNTSDLKAALRPLQIVSAREVEVGHGKKAIVIFVPVPSLQGFHRVQQRLTRELEKKFSDRHVLFLASRRILPPKAPQPLPYLADSKATPFPNTHRRSRRHPHRPRLPRRDRRQASPHQGRWQQGPEGRPR